MKSHKKHAHLTKPNKGIFHNHEYSIIGAPCPRIKEITLIINQELKSKYSLVYMDDDHDQDEVQDLEFAAELQNKIKHLSFNFTDPHMAYDYGIYLDRYDGVLLNGNHYTARKQIVIINQKKKESLSKKLDRLTDVMMIIYDEGESEVYDYLDDLDAISDVPKFHISDIDQISGEIEKDIDQNIPSLSGLVLVGGKSQRMRMDKAKIQYRNQSQLLESITLLKSKCETVHISVSDNSEYDYENQIKDSFVGLGPFGGILSAFRSYPNQAILCLPIDTPLIDDAFLDELISQRNPSKYATCFYNPETELPEPLITIWEPRSYARLLHFLSIGYSCPRKVLINSDIELIQTKHPEKMKNANTLEEKAAIQKMIKLNQWT